MATRADSYSSAAEIVPLTRYVLRGQSTFNTTTIPTLTEVEKFIDRASGVLNLALRGEGLTIPINSTNADSTSKLLCDDWVTSEVAAMVELTQPGSGLNELEGSRAGTFRGLHARALEFAKMHALGLKRQGAAVSEGKAEGLKYTGIDDVTQRDDPTDTTLAQPKFTRDLFDEGEYRSTSIWGG